MRSRFSFVALFLGLASLLAWAIAAQSSLAGALQPQPGAPATATPAPTPTPMPKPPAIVGVWLVTVGCCNPVGTAIFGADGELVATNPAAYFGTAYGTWDKKTDQEFTYTLVILPGYAPGAAHRIRGTVITNVMGDRWNSDEPIIDYFNTDTGGWVRGNLGPVRSAVRVK